MTLPESIQQWRDRITLALANPVFTRRLALGGLIVVSLTALAVGGVALISMFVEPDVPDPRQADLKTAAEFIKTEDFARLSTAQRGEYMDKVMKRYVTLPTEQRQEVLEGFRSLEKQQRRRTLGRAWMSWAIHQSGQVAAMNPTQRANHIDSMINMAEMVHGREKMEKNFQRGPMDRGRPRDLDRFNKRFSRLIYRTSAKERADMAFTAGEVMQRMKARYAKK